jgi:hypothetical protein
MQQEKKQKPVDDKYKGVKRELVSAVLIDKKGKKTIIKL